MSVADELGKLDELRARGAISEEEFARAKAKALGNGGEMPAVDPVAAVNRLRRSRGDRWIAGVCGGVARITGVESWIWRLVLAALAFFGGTGVLLYILLWIFVPEEP